MGKNDSLVGMSDTAYTGHVLLLMAPTGSGKGTLEKHVFQLYPEVLFAVSCTSRVMRPGEKNGREYYFISREQFAAKIEAGEFLEWAEFGGNLYGTLKAELLHPLQSGQLIINEIELQGIEQIKEIIPAADRTIVYIEAGAWEVLAKRVVERAPISPEELEKRYLRYEHEVASKPHADIVIDNTDGNLENAKRAFAEVVQNILKTLP